MLFVVRCWLCVGWLLLIVACFLLFVESCSLCGVRCVLCVVCCFV